MQILNIILIYFIYNIKVMYCLISHLINNPSTTYVFFYNNDNNENGNSIQYEKSLKKSFFISETQFSVDNISRK